MYGSLHNLIGYCVPVQKKQRVLDLPVVSGLPVPVRHWLPRVGLPLFALCGGYAENSLISPDLGCRCVAPDVSKEEGEPRQEVQGLHHQLLVVPPLGPLLHTQQGFLSRL